MPAAQELLIDFLVTAAAIAGREARCRKGKAVVFLLTLSGRSLMAIQTVHALLGVLAHFVLVDHRILSSGVALRTLSGGPHELPARLLRLNLWPGAVDEEPRNQEC